ncbi:MAG: hypothetical protein GY765_41955 [bacterium]|nr:hypothetical protein [bacterium]
MSESKGINRRRFLKNSILGVAGTGAVLSGGLPISAAEPPGAPLKIKSFRTLGRTGFKTSDIASGGPSNLAVLNAMLDAGVNYIDTAESYAKGKSEIITGQGIKNRDRKSLFVTSKLHLEKNDSKEAILKRARGCLERLDTPYLDCMMLHGPTNVKMVTLESFHAAMKQLKTEGKLRFVGISSHGSRNPVSPPDVMEKVLAAGIKDGRFDVVLLVYNFIQKGMGERLLALCKEKNIGATLMKTNPVGKYMDLKEKVEARKKSGEEIPPRMLSRFESMKSTAEKGDAFVKKYGLTDSNQMRAASTRYVLTNKNAANVLCRCGSFADFEQFLALSGSTISDMEVKKLAAFSRGPGRFYCRHACGKCESVCPQNVPVNQIMRYNHYFEAQGLEKYAMEKYAVLEKAADLCSTCNGECEAACPYGVPVSGLLPLAHDRLCFPG